MSQAWNKNHYTHQYVSNTTVIEEQQHEKSRAVGTVSQAWNKNHYNATVTEEQRHNESTAVQTVSQTWNKSHYTHQHISNTTVTTRGNSTTHTKCNQALKSLLKYLSTSCFIWHTPTTSLKHMRLCKHSAYTHQKYLFMHYYICMSEVPFDLSDETL